MLVTGRCTRSRLDHGGHRIVPPDPDVVFPPFTTLEFDDKGTIMFCDVDGLLTDSTRDETDQRLYLSVIRTTAV